MHPHNVSRSGSSGPPPAPTTATAHRPGSSRAHNTTSASGKAAPAVESARLSATAGLSSLVSPRNAAISGSRRSTPRKSHVSSANTTPRRRTSVSASSLQHHHAKGSAISTPVRRDSSGSHLRSTASTRARRRSSSLTAAHTDAGGTLRGATAAATPRATTPVDHNGTHLRKRSAARSPYKRPTSLSAQPLSAASLREQRHTPTRVAALHGALSPRKGDSAAHKVDYLAALSISTTPRTAAARRKSSQADDHRVSHHRIHQDAADDPNEPFAEPSTAPVQVLRASAQPSAPPSRTAATTSPTRRRAAASAPTSSSAGAKAFAASLLPPTTSASSHVRGAGAATPSRDSLPPHAAEFPFLVSPRHNDSGTSKRQPRAEAALPAASPAHAFLLPACLETELQQLFMVLCQTPHDSVCSLHRHIVPFIAAHRATIMPVTVCQLSAFLGDPAAVQHLAESAQQQQQPVTHAGPLPSFSGEAVSRFASELCYWFLFAGELANGEAALSWEELLCGGHSTSDEASQQPGSCAQQLLPQSTTGGGNAAVPDVLTLPSLLSSNDKPATASPATSSRSSSPAVVHRNGKEGDEDVKTDCNDHTVTWQSMGQTPALANASATAASVDLRPVMQFQPYISAETWKHGYGVLQAMLSQRDASLTAAAAQSKEGEEEKRTCGGLAALVSAAQDAASVQQLHDDGGFRLLPAVRAGLRRAEFYLRLVAFVQQLCECQRRHEASSWQRSSNAVEAILQSRLSMSAAHSATTGHHADAPEQMAWLPREGTQTPRSLPLQLSWIGSSLLHGVLRRAILRATPVASIDAYDRVRRRRSSAVNAAAAAPTAFTAVDTLDILLVLRNREVASIVQSATGAASTAATVPTLTEQRSLPVSLLHLFPLPRWCSWRRSKENCEAEHLLPLTAVALCVLSVAVLTTTAAAALAMLSLHSVRLVWWRSWLSEGRLLSWGRDAVLLLLTCVVGRWLGAWAVRLAYQYGIVQAHCAQLTSTASSAWLYSAWALRQENVLASVAVQHCTTRLELLCRAVECVVRPSLTVPLTDSPVCTLIVAVLGMLITLIPRSWAFLHTLARLLAVLVAAVWSVLQSWQRCQHVVEWRLRVHVGLAESFAVEVLQSAAVMGGNDQGVSQAGGDATSTPFASLDRHPPLCALSLPLLEELVKVATLVQWCESLSARATATHTECPPPQHPSSCDSLQPFPAFCTSIAALRSVEELPMCSFWEQLCGNAAPAHMGAAPAVVVVRQTQQASVATLHKLHPGLLTSCVVQALSVLLPWAEGDVSSHASESTCDPPMAEVLAPVMASAPLTAGSATPAPAYSSSPPPPSWPAAPEQLTCAFDVELRRTPYLSTPQRQLLVCAAFVFAALHMAPCPRTASCIAEQTLLVLVHLVHGAMNSEQTPAVRSPVDAQWREAERRTREGLRHIQHRMRSMASSEASCAEDGVSLLPQLSHTLFA